MPYGVSWSELDRLKTPTLESGYWHVYRKRNGWQAKGPDLVTLTCHGTVIEAAAAVIRRCREMFGAEWWKCKERAWSPFEFEPVRVNGLLSFRVRVWINGVRHDVPGAWPTEADAEEGAKVFASRQAGLFVDSALSMWVNRKSSGVKRMPKIEKNVKSSSTLRNRKRRSVDRVGVLFE